MSDQVGESSAETKMVNPPTQQKKLVKVKLLRPSQINGKTVEPSKDPKKPVIVEVDEARASELCRENHGQYAFSGERYDEVTRHNIANAVRV